ncbi:unnamed protein product [Rotaria sordida]|uniref:Uncharacterized protein n=1 Tax=Rotaria sordida TaxID=392033 RepID=A0A815LY82_9BILA|nr:unnamed protein product [Rotaria sordida]CAF1628336.1 unnamed protein product [Rotaria sordida]
MHFNDSGIELIKGDEWVQFYHTFLNNPMAKSMIEDRVKLGQIIEFNGRFGLNKSHMNGTIYESGKKTTNKSGQQEVEENLYLGSVINNAFSDQSNLLASSSSDFLPPRPTTDESPMEIETFELCIDKENMVDAFHPIDDNSNPPRHSTPINNKNNSSSTILPVDPVTSSSNLPDGNGIMILSSVINNGCSSSPINRNSLIQSISTDFSSPLQLMSSNSINKIIEVLNSSSIQLGLTSPNWFISIVDIMEHHQSHEDKQPYIDDTIKENLIADVVVDVLQDMINLISIAQVTVADRSLVISKIAKVVENDKHPIWKKLILNKHVLATSSDLSRTVTGSDGINAARQSCIEKLLDIGCFLNGDSFLNGKQKAFLKNSPEDDRLISALNKYDIDINEYKESFNNHLPFIYKNGIPVPAVLNNNTNKNKFTQAFVDKLQSDPFYSAYLRIDLNHVVKPSLLKRKTTSSYETDFFRAQKVAKRAHHEKHD